MKNDLKGSAEVLGYTKSYRLYHRRNSRIPEPVADRDR